MQTNLPIEKKRQVLDYKALPTRVTALWLSLLYFMYSKVYELPLWCDVVTGGLLVLLAIIQFIAIGQEQRVNPFN